MTSKFNHKSKVLETILNRLDCHVYWKNKHGHYLWCNKKLANVLGFKNENDIIGKTDYELFAPDLAKAVVALDKAILNEGKEYQTEEIGFDSENRKAIYLSIKTPIKNELGCADGLIGISIDITARKQSEIAKQEFLMNMAHDLRTPLSGIIGLSYILSKEGTKTEDRQNGQWIQDAGNQLLELLNLVLEVSAAEHHHIETILRDSIYLEQIVEELQALMQPVMIAKGLDLQIKLDTNLPLISTDRIKLKRLLLNLLGNAVKFTKEGKVSLEIKLLSVKRNKAKVEILVADTGIGIAEDKLDKIFDRFYRVHPSYEAQYTGYGIGLYLVKKTLELLGGKIKVSSEEGKGSYFALEFTFPLAEENLEQTACSTSQPQADSFKSHSELDKHAVLVAEDNTLVLHVVKNLLVNLGYDVITVMDGKAALNTLQTQDFNWALLDIGLPSLAGTEIVKAYRQWEIEHKKPRLPLFALTAHAIEEVKEKCEAVGFDYILNKPFTEKDVQIIKLFMENKK